MLDLKRIVLVLLLCCGASTPCQEPRSHFEGMSALELAIQPLDETVAEVRLERSDVAPEERERALAWLLERRQSDRITELLAAASRPDSAGKSGAAAMLRHEARGELAARGEELLDLVTSTGAPAVRRELLAALLTADGSAVRALSQPDRLAALESLALVEDADALAGCAAQVAAFLTPTPLAGRFFEMVPARGEALEEASIEALGEHSQRIDLDSTRAVSAVRVWTTGPFSISLLDDARRPVWSMRNVPAPQVWVEIPLVITPTPAERAAAAAAAARIPALRARFAQAATADTSGEIPASILERGRAVYMGSGGCMTCHQANGKGIPGVFPPLIKSPWVQGSEERLLKIVLTGLQGTVEVDGFKYSNGMAPLGKIFTDDKVAAVLTYVRNSWGNEAPAVTEATVSRIRTATADRTQPWTVRELLEAHPLESDRATPSASAPPTPPPAAPLVVFVAGDDEYRSEESMPMLAGILERLGLRTRVVYSTSATDIPGLAILREADLLVLFARFRSPPDEQLQYLLDYSNAGKPIVGFRTATHAFRYGSGAHQDMNELWPREVFGQNWITHHGHFGDNAERLTAVTPLPAQSTNPILRGVEPFECFSWLYHVAGGGDGLTGECAPLAIGHAMKSSHEQAGKQERFPLDQPVAWTKAAPERARVFFTTLGHPFDFMEPSMRRLAIQGIFWALDRGADIPPAGCDVTLAGPYAPNRSGEGNRK